VVRPWKAWAKKLRWQPRTGCNDVNAISLQPFLGHHLWFPNFFHPGFLGKHYYQDWTGVWTGILIQHIQYSPTLIQVRKPVSWKYSIRTFRILTANTDIQYATTTYYYAIVFKYRRKQSLYSSALEHKCERPILNYYVWNAWFVAVK